MQLVILRQLQPFQDQRGGIMDTITVSSLDRVEKQG
jgi:hypothetical protein